MADQSTLDALVAAEQADLATIATAIDGLTAAATKIADEIAALKAAQPTLDLTALQAAQADLDAKAAALTAATGGVESL